MNQSRCFFFQMDTVKWRTCIQYIRNEVTVALCTERKETFLLYCVTIMPARPYNEKKYTVSHLAQTKSFRHICRLSPFAFLVWHWSLHSWVQKYAPPMAFLQQFTQDTTKQFIRIRILLRIQTAWYVFRWSHNRSISSSEPLSTAFSGTTSHLGHEIAF